MPNQLPFSCDTTGKQLLLAAFKKKKPTEKDKDEIQEVIASLADAKEVSVKCCSSGCFSKDGWNFHIKRRGKKEQH